MQSKLWVSLVASLILVVSAAVAYAAKAKPVTLAAYLKMSADERYALFAKLHERLAAGEKAAKLADTIPGLDTNLKTARQVSEDHWTDSTPFDELAKAYILSEKVLDGLGIKHQMTGEVMHVPAGVMHSYGYLFAQLKTAFGLKGKRWIESRLDERLGFSAGSFSPFAPKGEFLSNLTAALMYATGELGSTKALKKMSPDVARVLKAAEEPPLQGTVTELVEWKTPGGQPKAAEVQTHLVKLKTLEGFTTGEVYLLVYKTVVEGKHRYVTAFPIDQKFADSIQGTKPSKGDAFKPRFNLYVDPTWKVVKYENQGFRAAGH